MPLKWNITGKAMKARGIMDQISAEYDGFITDGSEHLGDVKGLRDQVGEMKDDLYAAANIMGNSGGGSNGAGETKEPPVVTDNSEQAKSEQPVSTTIVAQPGGVAATGSATFPAGAGQL